MKRKQPEMVTRYRLTMGLLVGKSHCGTLQSGQVFSRQNISAMQTVSNKLYGRLFLI